MKISKLNNALGIYYTIFGYIFILLLLNLNRRMVSRIINEINGGDIETIIPAILAFLIINFLGIYAIIATVTYRKLLNSVMNNQHPKVYKLRKKNTIGIIFISILFASAIYNGAGAVLIFLILVSPLFYYLISTRKYTSEIKKQLIIESFNKPTSNEDK